MANFNNSNEERKKHESDQVWPGHVDYRLGFGSAHGGETMWRCNVLRAGKVYSSSLFGSREEAEEFAKNLSNAEPDKMFNVESIRASAVWN